MNKPTQSTAPSKAPAKRKNMTSVPGYQRTAKHSMREALELSLAFLAENKIKPSMTLKEYAEFTGQELRQVQSDATRKYLPLRKRQNPLRRELMQVNMVALYAIPFMEGAEILENRA